jgi:chaperonin GroES
LIENDTLDPPEDDDFDATDDKPVPFDRLMQFAQNMGDICDLLDDHELSELGHDVVTDYRRDDQSRADWKTKAVAALKVAAQEHPAEKSYPFDKASNVHHPMLTVASQQFAARAMPAIVKGDEAIGVKVIGEAPSQPQLPEAPPGQQPPPEVVKAQQAFQQAVGAWRQKQARAKRVKTYLNYQLFYQMDDWEGDTDALLHQLPVVGCGFRKVYYHGSEGRSCADFVTALNLVVPIDTKSLKRCPRITQEFELYPYEIDQRIRSGMYRDPPVSLIPEGDDDQAPRKMLEQHRLHDLDGDGVEEPYVITVDEQTEQVLRIDAAFGPNDVKLDTDKQDGHGRPRVISIERWVPYVKYEFLPDPKGRFYGIGFGHLLGPLTDVINTTINQLIDAGHAQVAGGGFIASGLRIQNAGQGSTIRWQPGEYKTVNVSGNDLRAAIYERTLPGPSPVLFELLDLILGAAKDIASVKDVITGDAPANAPVGTTLALIEQGLQVFTAIYKRIYRAEREEFQLLYDCEGRYGSGEDYADVVDDPSADFKADFSRKGHDIAPVSDPTVVTKMQALAKAQVIGQVNTMFPGAINPQAGAKRILEAAEVDDADQLVAAPQQPNPLMLAKVEETKASAAQKNASALKDTIEAGAGFGALHGAVEGGVSGLEGAPDQPMGVPGGQGGLGGAAGGMDAPVLGNGAG